MHLGSKDIVRCELIAKIVMSILAMASVIALVSLTLYVCKLIGVVVLAASCSDPCAELVGPPTPTLIDAPKSRNSAS